MKDKPKCPKCLKLEFVAQTSTDMKTWSGYKCEGCGHTWKKEKIKVVRGLTNWSRCDRLYCE